MELPNQHAELSKLAIRSLEVGIKDRRAWHQWHYSSVFMNWPTAAHPSFLFKIPYTVLLLDLHVFWVWVSFLKQHPLKKTPVQRQQ